MPFNGVTLEEVVAVCMDAPLVKPLALVDNRTGHLMLLVDARTLEVDLEGGTTCHVHPQEGGRYLLDLATEPLATRIGPFNASEADKLRLCHRLTIAAFRDGMVTRAREVAFREVFA